jgi:hypothetical protein
MTVNEFANVFTVCTPAPMYLNTSQQSEKLPLYLVFGTNHVSFEFRYFCIELQAYIQYR